MGRRCRDVQGKLVRQVKFLRDHCDMMTDLIEKRHGADLYPVEHRAMSEDFGAPKQVWLDALKAEGWTGRIVTNMQQPRLAATAQARRTV